MSRTFNSSNQYVVSGSDPVTVAPIAALSGVANATVAGWMWRATTSDTCWFGEYVYPFRFGCLWYLDNTLFALCENGTDAFGTVSLSGTGWHHFVLVYDGGGSGNSDKLKLYYDGSLQTLDFSSYTIPGTKSSGANQAAFTCALDFAGGGNRFWGGANAETAAWNVSLTADEALALASGVLPKDVRPMSLVMYWPLFGLNSPEPDLLPSGATRHLGILGNSPASGYHPPVLPFSRRWWLASAPLIEETAGGSALLLRLQTEGLFVGSGGCL